MNRSLCGVTDSMAFEDMPETKDDAQLLIQRSSIDKNGQVLMHRIVNQKGEQSES